MVVITANGVATRAAMSRVELVVFAVVCALGLAAAIATLLGKQRVVVTAAALVLRLTGWRKTVPLSDITLVESYGRTTELEFGGYGVRLAGKGVTALVANPGPCVRVAVGGRRPRTYIIRTDRPEALVSSLDDAARPVPGR
ncbi:hypothetical protein MF406_14420 [Georgenia sp. TF02-10]|uniref:hypothetical protein n=1 Tax=Georgenia sp. TF02-10 TaxID=2917725 RepID=UPI001FA7A61B|nr:hypothetical protein [Georgenia sp. TF02-10]UNX54125.1 hypothetical protein MF406_14420 [Georgenia sp. TF02-10]